MFLSRSPACDIRPLVPRIAQNSHPRRLTTMEGLLKLVLSLVLLLFFTGHSQQHGSTESGSRPKFDWSQTVAAVSSHSQQVGARCYASPRCPDCNGRGNVCSVVQEFFPGVTVLAAKRFMIDKCRRANGLDYCGGSYQCVRQRGWTPQQGAQYKARYSGGCYKQCDNSVVCVLANR